MCLLGIVSNWLAALVAIIAEDLFCMVECFEKSHKLSVINVLPILLMITLIHLLCFHAWPKYHSSTPWWSQWWILLQYFIIHCLCIWQKQLNSSKNKINLCHNWIGNAARLLHSLSIILTKEDSSSSHGPHRTDLSESIQRNDYKINYKSSIWDCQLTDHNHKGRLLLMWAPHCHF